MIYNNRNNKTSYPMKLRAKKPPCEIRFRIRKFRFLILFTYVYYKIKLLNAYKINRFFSDVENVVCSLMDILMVNKKTAFHFAFLLFLS